MISPYQAVHSASKAFEETFNVYGSFINVYAEHGGMGVSLMFERPMGIGRGRDAKGFSLVNYERLDTLETRQAIARAAYRTIRDLAGQKDLGPDAMPDMNVMGWVGKVCDELCR